MQLGFYPDRTEFRAMAEKGNLIPVCMELLADTETPVSALAKIYDGHGPVFLLESMEGGERWGRYSFLGSSATKSVRVFREDVEIESETGKERIAHEGDPLKVLRSLMAGYKPVKLSRLPRFWGGLVGYFAYEFISFFEQIPNRLPADEPLAHFILPGQLFIFDNVRHTLSLVAYALVENGEADKAYDRALDTLHIMQSKLEGPLEPFPRPEQNDFSLKRETEPEKFRADIARIREYIREGDIIQAVYSQRFSCATPPDPRSLYRAQRFINPSPYLYFLHFDDTILVGSSPETMVRLENGVATLRPIAGTKPRGKTEQQDRELADELLKDEKERAEHLMLVDLGRNDLGRVAEIGSVQVTDLMVVERYSHVMHLVSNINCDLREGLDAFDLFRAAFPAGTLTGAPKVRAMEIIAELEDEPRGPYGGAIGYFSYTGNMDLAITIRTACIRDGELTVRAGAGIVADSDPERERQETINKAKSIHRALQMLEGKAGGA
ncbi:MAG: anthranilate synthase component I family protein [Syntrophobacteraceae bacterium]|nr:anthranilate synthase component I family protein [Syntrophobacteraceae bacterium]